MGFHLRLDYEVPEADDNSYRTRSIFFDSFRPPDSSVQ
jgi:hypothetical protein